MDEQHMYYAIQLALKAKGRTSPNPMVGAVIVKDGVIVGEGFHLKAGTPHAEVHALRMAGKLAMGATLYVTLEPCAHFGRTPPCCDVIIAAGITEVFVAMEDPNPLVSGKGIQKMIEAGLTVHIGLLEEAARRLNEIFIKHITTKKPFIILKSAMTLDGKIATYTGHSKWITGEKARHRVHEVRNECDAIMVGINTVIADDPALTCRLPEGGRDPIRIVLDSLARTPLLSRVLIEDSPAKVYIAVSEKASQEKIMALEEAEAEIIRVPEDHNGKLDLNSLLENLGARNITSLLVEGGSEVAASLLQLKLVDKVVVFIAPKLIGGATAPTPIGGSGIASMEEAISLREVKTTVYGEDLCIEGYPVYN